MKKILFFALVFCAIFSAAPARANTSVGSELNRFEDEDRDRKMKEMLELDSDPLIQFSDEAPESSKPAKK